MLKKLVLLLGLASSLAAAVPAPEYTAGGSSSSHESIVISDLSRVGSVSDNSCFVREVPNTAPWFPKPRADSCLNIEAFRKIKIFAVATCRNGTEALFARYTGPGCIGEPASLDVVGEDMLKTCLDMPARESVGSYGFWCDGIEKQQPPPPSPPKKNTGGGGGSIWGLIGILLLILVTVLLIAGLKLASCISRASDTGNRFLGIFGKREGEIALR
ncbi:hypothetical protein BJ166DRAFT_297694 [Pestalotiopsis sp. NC0098]|nr:hypothetical protein BJ166DRAFT_297694 [Pestalotiopsis sp. NC0098]